MLEFINILDKQYQIEFSEKLFLKPNVLKTTNKLIVFKSIEYQIHRSILKEWLVKEAKKIIKKRVEIISQSYNFEYRNVAVKDQSSIWGSCSSKKNLNFSWRLILAPSLVLDYVIIHELCHTKQMNHSKNFWNSVEDIIPNYKSFKQWLDDNGKNIKKI